MRVRESAGKSLHVNGMPGGCRHCIKGEKAVIFLGGECPLPDHCRWYCPISRERKGPGVFIDELPVMGDGDLLEELHAIDARGISFTGGEPMSGPRWDKVLRYLDILKAERPSLHAHLYTTGIPATASKLEDAASHGLDEIRFHPPPGQVEVITLARGIIPAVGVEVPAIPEPNEVETIKALIRHLEAIEADFINLNEFEFADTNASSLSERGFVLKEGTIAAVSGSEEAAASILTWYAEEIGGALKVHYCPIVTKDEYQLVNRYRRRAMNTRHPWEDITPDGTIVFGRARLAGDDASVQAMTGDLRAALGGKARATSMDPAARTLLFKPGLLRNKKFRSILFAPGVDAGIVEALPTRDREECEFTPLDAILKDNSSA